MIIELKSRRPVDAAYQELCANFIGFDIYIIDAVRNDVYPTSNGKILYKNRPSIFIYYKPGHYDVLALPMKNSYNKYAGLLTTDHPFTIAINNRCKELEN
jgi:hypothetical protein